MLKDLKFCITLGDPNGIGSEVVVKSLYYLCRKDFTVKFIVIGNKKSFLKACKISEITPDLKNIVGFIDIKSQNLTLKNEPSAEAGKVAYNSIYEAVKLCKKGITNAMVTAPISKRSLHLAKYFFDGHTGLLANLLKVKEPYLMLSNKKFSTLHVTCHLSLRKAIDTITVDKLLHVVRIGNSHMKKLGLQNPRIAICGLNPHSGENGYFGDEEIKYFLPALDILKKEGVNIAGPISADTIFRDAFLGKYDLIIANYHDQGHIPVKLLYFDQSVNITLGIPIVRTSVDHGTAFDIAFKNKAKSINMIASILHAVRICSI